MPLEPTSYAVPQNPNAALMDYRIQGPMAGLMVGEQEAALDRAKQQQQIQNNNANAINDIIVSQAQKDVPLNDLTRENKIAEQQFTKTNQQQIDESKVLEMMAKKSANERQMASDRAEAYVAVGQSMPDATDDSPAARAKYQALRASQSPEIQAKLPPEWSPQTHAFVTGLMGQSKVVMSANAKIAEEAPKLASAERIAGANQASAERRAAIMADAKGTDPDKIIREVRQKEASGEPLTPDLVANAFAADKNKYGPKDPDQKTDKLSEAYESQLREDMGKNKKKYAEEAAKVGLPATADPATVARKKARKQVLDEQISDFAADHARAKVIVDGKETGLNTPKGQSYLQDLLGGTGQGGGGAAGVTGKPTTWNAVGAPEPVTSKSGQPAYKIRGDDGQDHFLKPDDPRVKAAQAKAATPPPPQALTPTQPAPAPSQSQTQYPSEARSASLAVLDQQIQAAARAGNNDLVQKYMQARQQIVAQQRAQGEGG